MNGGGQAIEFPQSFLWGCATSAYQVEGSPLADGAGPSVWHRFTRTPGLVRDGDSGDGTTASRSAHPKHPPLLAARSAA